MTQENKDLLLKDLCARLPYGVKVQRYSYEDDVETIETLYEIDSDGCMSTLECDTLKYIAKPYLFPLSSMTEEQEEEYESLCIKETSECADLSGFFFTKDYYYDTVESIDYLYKNHIDIRGLIEKGLAIDATELNIY